MDWPTAVVSFASGGAFGSVLTAVIQWWRARRQPIAYRVEVVPLMEGPLGEFKLTVERSGLLYNYDNISSVDIEIINTGNRDHEHFEFGVTMLERHPSIAYSVESSDRHHQATLLPTPSHEVPAHVIDVRLEPFNRRDRYLVRLNATRLPGLGGQSPPLVEELVEVSTKEPVVLKRAGSTQELVAELRTVAVRGILGTLVR